MKKTLSFLVIFAFLFSSVFTTGCFDSKNGIFSTRALGFFGLALVVAASGGAASTVAFVANTRGVSISNLKLADHNVTVKIYDYSKNVKEDGAEPLFSAKPTFDAASGTFKLETTAEDEAKLTGIKQLLIEVEATFNGTTAVVMSSVYYTNKFVDLQNVTIDFGTSALRVAYEKWLETNSGKDFIQFAGNADATKLDTLADNIEDITSSWLASASATLATPTATLVDDVATSAGTATFCRVYCEAIPGTEKDGDFEFVDVRKYFEIYATEVGSSTVHGPFEIYSDATFDFYLESGKSYTFSVSPKAGENLEDIFGEDVEKTKESDAIEIAAGTTEKKLVAEDFTDKVIQ